jgi:tetratricopeptide (TPR) repeat protein
MQYFEHAREAYRAGRYPEAAEDLERALVLDPNAPALLFNLGRVYELMGRYDDSIEIYTRLRAFTPPDATAELARTDEILERLRGAREHAAPPPTVEIVGAIEQCPTFVRERGVADEAFWGTLIAGGVVVIGAAIVGGLALSMHDGLSQRVLGSVDDSGHIYTYDDFSAELTNAQTLGLVADIGYGVGGATMVAALILFAVRERVYEQWPDGRQVSLDLGPGSVSLRGVF